MSRSRGRSLLLPLEIGYARSYAKALRRNATQVKRRHVNEKNETARSPKKMLLFTFASLKHSFTLGSVARCRSIDWSAGTVFRLQRIPTKQKYYTYASRVNTPYLMQPLCKKAHIGLGQVSFGKSLRAGRNGTRACPPVFTRYPKTRFWGLFRGIRKPGFCGLKSGFRVVKVCHILYKICTCIY